MKHILFLSISAIVFAGVLSSCKKGEDDPFLSLRSRKARIEGTWTLTSFESRQTSTSSSGTSVTTTFFDSGTETHTQTLSPTGFPATTTTDVSNYTEQFIFEKDGTYVRTHTDSDGVMTTKGTWFFLGKSKENEIKNKEAIYLTETNTTYDGASTAYTGLVGQTLIIKQLKNEEMVLTSSSTTTGEDYSNSQESVTVLTQD